MGLSLLALALAPVDPSIEPAPAAPQGLVRRVKVLWLGDDGHHTPLFRCRQVFSIFARQGIDFTYTQDVNCLNPQTLNRYDCLFLYANINRIAPEQEKALIDYVEAGHGFVPVHCGSYCFLNSTSITALVGGRFKSHNTGVFKETIVAADHPIEKGLHPIESWDETYVHEMHNEQGRQVLGYRIEGDHKEPYTWVRTQGKGRVFYTAWGHDERTWGNEDFQQLLIRGIRWAAGDWALSWQPLPPEPQAHTDAPIPNYLPNQKWGVEGAQIHSMQEPIRPAESIKHMVLPPGFEARLYAGDPDIYKPIAIAFDERGRLWVSETIDYPNSMQQPGEGHDRIVICEDTKGTGVADKFTVFADKLSIPTSLCFANGGVIVAQAPDLLFLKSTRGDDHADVRQTLITGWGTRDTHAGPSNLRWGFDNWVYGTVGYSGFKGTVGGQEMSFGAGIFRLKPDGSKLEFLGSTNNNTWGLGLTEDNQVFASTANGNCSNYLHIANRYYESVKGWSVKRLEPIADTQDIFPVSDKVRQMDHHGQYTAGAGHAIYTARSLPKEYWNRIAFVAEPTAHLLGQFVLEPQGSGFTTLNDFNLFSSTDEWTAPICGEVGPDGAVWMTDWYNFIVQHNPIPHGFEGGKGGAYITPLRDQTHGRVYRLVYADGTPGKTYDLSKATAAELVDVLKSDNMLWRMHAQRLMVEKADKSIVPALVALAQDASVDAIGLNPAVIHALWTLQGLGALGDEHGDGAIDAAVAVAENDLRHASAGARKAAVDVLPRTARSVEAILAGKLLEDKDAQVRKSALLALSEMPPSDPAGLAVYSILGRPENAGDRWISDAAAIAAARHDSGFLKAVFAAHPATSGESLPAPVEAERPNLVPNPSFEQAPNGKLKSWKIRHYSGEAQQELAGIAHTGKNSVRLHSDTGADTSWHVEVKVTPNTEYRLSGWIKTENVQRIGDAQGALLNVHETDFKTRAIIGTNDWTQVQVDFNSGPLSSVSINCLFGGWGHARGTAWYDDIELVEAHGLSLSASAGPEGKVIEAVVHQYAERGPVDSVAATLAAVSHTDPSVALVVLDSLANGWPRTVAGPNLSEAQVTDLRSLMNTLKPDARNRLLALAERWGRKDLFADQAVAAGRDLRVAVADASLNAAKRADAARKLLSIDDNQPALETILAQINPKTDPEVQLGLLGALADSRNADLGGLLVKQWDKLTPGSQKVATDLLVRRGPWAQSLLGAVKSGVISSKDLLPQQWQTLTSFPDEAIAAEARDLQQAGHPANSDRKALVDKAMPLLDKKGDPARGRLVFEKNCMVCHTIDGKGGKVGPELTGIGARPKVDNLIQILDPNRSVEGTYKQWTARTDDDAISGRLYAESKTSVDLIDSAGQIHSIQRDQIKSLKQSDKGVMPEGFEQLPEDDIVNVLAYLDTSKVKR
jgi:putative membrane-bound dehydrogenase-like protein